MFRTLLLLTVSFLMLGTSLGCTGSSREPTTVTNRPPGLQRAGGPPAQGSGGEKTPPGGVIEQ